MFIKNSILIILIYITQTPGEEEYFDWGYYKGREDAILDKYYYGKELQDIKTAIQTLFMKWAKYVNVTDLTPKYAPRYWRWLDKAENLTYDRLQHFAKKLFSYYHDTLFKQHAYVTDTQKDLLEAVRTYLKTMSKYEYKGSFILKRIMLGVERRLNFWLEPPSTPLFATFPNGTLIPL